MTGLHWRVKNKTGELMYGDLTEKIIGACYGVHYQYGSGQKELVYQKALEEKFTGLELPFRREEEITINSLDSGKKLGNYRLDFVVDDKVVVETKAIKFTPIKMAQQLFSYLRNSGYKVGLMVNFGSSKLYIKRIILCIPVLFLLFLCAFISPRASLAANSGQFTMSLWVNPTTSVASKALLSKAEEFRIFTNASGFVGCQIKTSTWQTAAQATTKNLTLNTWNSVICTYDLVNLKVYVNGVNVATQALTSLPDDTAAVLRLGQDDSASTTYTNLSGIIDEFKFYNYALTLDEVKTEYNRGSSLILGNLGTSSTAPFAPLNSSSSSYCVPGDTTSCSPPVAEWNFEEGSGTSAYDTSGNNITGSLGVGDSAPLWSPGKIGKALKYDGSNDYVSVTLSSSLANNYTVEGWVYLNTGGNYAGNRQGLLSETCATTAEVLFRGDTYTSPQQIELGKCGAYNGTLSTGTFSLRTWTHIGVTVNSSKLVTYYINGVNSGTFDASAVDTTINTAIHIGSNGSSRVFDGLLDQVRIFNYARTPAQIAWDYNQGKPIGHWRFDECTGASAKDSSGNANTGTITIGASGTQTSVGTCTTSAASSRYNGATGKFNASLNFDGTDDYVNQPTSISGAQSVSFWAYPASTTASMLQLTASANVTASSGTISATGFTSPTIYVNGKSGGSLTASAWNHIVVTTATGITANAVKLGLVGSTYFSGQIDDVRIYNYALTPLQVKNIYNESSAIRFGP